MDKFDLPTAVSKKLHRHLHKCANHPLEITKRLVYSYFDDVGTNFEKYEDFPEAVSVFDNFDSLRIPRDHPARAKSDTFYLSEDTVLRTHTTAHQNALLSRGKRNFIIVGDVYRRDSVDKTHYPIFHQLEGVMQTKTTNPVQELTSLMQGLVKRLFPGHESRVSSDYFPFTEPSLEVEVLFGDRWLEILGCGVVHRDILSRLEIQDSLIAWGIGLERLAMILFQIPDIRLFWSEDDKFINQFTSGCVTKFKPYTHIDPVDRDISFWLPDKAVVKLEDPDDFEWADSNTFAEFVREAGGELVESVDLFDKFFHPKRKLYSHSFRIKFSPVSSWHNAAHLARVSNETMQSLRDKIALEFGVTLR